MHAVGALATHHPQRLAVHLLDLVDDLEASVHLRHRPQLADDGLPPPRVVPVMDKNLQHAGMIGARVMALHDYHLTARLPLVCPVTQQRTQTQ